LEISREQASAVVDLIKNSNPEDILFTNPGTNGKQNDLKPIAKYLPIKFDFPDLNDAIPAPISKGEDAENFWKATSAAMEAWTGKRRGKVNELLPIEARLLTARRIGPKKVSFGYMNIREAAQLMRLFDNRHKIKESLFDYFTDSGTSIGGFSMNAPSTFNSEYAPLLGGPWSKQLYIRDQLDGNSKSFEAWNHNPIAHAAIQIKHDFVFGRGVTVKCQDDKQQQFWDQFEHETDFQNKLNKITLDASIAGEVMLRYFPGDKPGKLKFRSIDPSSVWEIITDPEDYEKIYSYWQNYPTPFLMTTLPGVPITKYIIRHVPPNEVDFIRLNVTSYERRGRPDLYSALTYLKWLKDYLWSKTVRAKVQNTYLWDITVEGNAGDVQAILNTFPNPQDAGMIFAHNKVVTLQSTNPSLGNEGRFLVAEILIALIGVSVGVPPEFLGSSGRGSRAGALLASEPATKHYQDRQEQLGWLIKRMAYRVFTEAESKGLLPKTKDEEKEVKVIWASITKEDRSAVVADGKVAEQMRWLSKESVASRIAEEFDMDDYDFSEEQQKIDEEKKEGWFGEAFTDQMPQGQDNMPGQPGQDTQDGAGVPPTDEQQPEVSKADKDAKANPMSVQSAPLRKQLKNAERTYIKLQLTESDL
jgi:hypothetical protein